MLCSEQKETYQRIASHAKYASNNDNNENSSITIAADNTDIYMLLLLRIACYCHYILYFCQGTSSNKAGITYHVSAAVSEFGESISKMFPSFQALTGSDFTETFYHI